eukprot:evm.model.scf_991.3 EVM.evm.TU.scf_991.3   scf_991:24418-24907(-)
MHRRGTASAQGHRRSQRSSAATSGVGGAPGTVPWPAELSTWGQEAALLQSLDSMGPDSIPAFN